MPSRDARLFAAVFKRRENRVLPEIADDRIRRRVDVENRSRNVCGTCVDPSLMRSFFEPASAPADAV